MATYFDLMRFIETWEPPVAPHCSNCAHCRVYGRVENPLVFCAAGLAKETNTKVELGRLIRPVRPVGFRAAARCSSSSARTLAAASPSGR